MRPGGGKSKGTAFEWKIARRFSLWLTNGEDQSQLVKSLGSGGWVGKFGDGAWRHVGDLAPNGPAGEEFRYQFAVECKHHKIVDFWHHWTCAPGDNLLGWWAKLQDEISRDAPHLRPLLVFRMNLRPVMVVCPATLVSPYSDIPRLVSPPHGFAVLRLEDWLSQPPERYFPRPRISSE